MDPVKAAMPVLVQERISWERTGTLCIRCSGYDDLFLVESQGCRWLLDRVSGSVRSFIPDRSGSPLPEGGHATVGAMLGEIHGLSVIAHEAFLLPTAVEWGMSGGRMSVLQVRPFYLCRGRGQETSSPQGLPEDPVPERHVANTYETGLRFLSDISDAAEACPEVALSDMPDPRLADEIEDRLSAYSGWKERFSKASIDLAHCMALFGRIYNDVVRPVDPCEFMEMLICDTKPRLRRAHLLKMMAHLVRYDEGMGRDDGRKIPGRARTLLQGHAGGFRALRPWRHWDRPGSVLPQLDGLGLMNRLTIPRDIRIGVVDRLAEDFLSRIPLEEREQVSGILDLARTDSMIRDQAGLQLGRLRKLLDDALDEGRRRLGARSPALPSPGDVILGLRDRDHTPWAGDGAGEKKRLEARQIVGHPAGRGIAVGRARVMFGDEGPVSFRKGEILVSDTIGHANAFVIPWRMQS
jgi:pyruvate,water dikinase